MYSFFKAAIIGCLLSTWSITYANDASIYQKKPQKAFALIQQCVNGDASNTEQCNVAKTAFDAFLESYENNISEKFKNSSEQDINKSWNKQRCAQTSTDDASTNYKSFINAIDCKIISSYKYRFDHQDAWAAYAQEYTKSTQGFAPLLVEELEMNINKSNFCTNNKQDYQHKSLEEAKELFLTGAWDIDASCFALYSLKETLLQSAKDARMQQYDDVYNQELTRYDIGDLDALAERRNDLEDENIACPFIEMGQYKTYAQSRDEAINYSDSELAEYAACGGLNDAFHQGLEMFKKPLLENIHNNDDAAMIEFVENYVQNCPSNDVELCYTYRALIYTEMKDLATKVKAEKLTKPEVAEAFEQYGCQATTNIRQPAEQYWICNVYAPLK